VPFRPVKVVIRTIREEFMRVGKIMLPPLHSSAPPAPNPLPVHLPDFSLG
jgi:hypothetical protein